MEYITIVDGAGKILGTEEKIKCHLKKGILHSAFLAMMFNDRNEIILSKRSQEKMLWPDFWDGTVASHYHPDIDREDSVKQRILYETGVQCRQLEYLFKFHYQAQYEDVGSENEICDVFAAKGIGSDQLHRNELEISEYKCLGISEISASIATNSLKISPWFVIAFKRYLQIGEESPP